MKEKERIALLEERVALLEMKIEYLTKIRSIQDETIREMKQTQVAQDDIIAAQRETITNLTAILRMRSAGMSSN